LWRFQIFDAICELPSYFTCFVLLIAQPHTVLASNFTWADPSTVTTLHDRPFACITLGRTARKQGLKEVATFSLNSLTDCTIDVEYAFLKLREQVVSFQNSSVESLKGGLALVNSTNLSFFDSRQKAEMFRLKAYFLSGK
jgi:transformation/transcription domain-associated protein